MATLIEAVNAHRTRVLPKDTIGMNILARRLAHGSFVNEGIARMVLTDLEREVRNALIEGHPVQLPGIGRFSVHMRLGGRMRLSVRADRRLQTALSNPANFEGDLLRAENIDLDTAAIVALWNEENPDDPVEPGFSFGQAA